MNEIKLTMSNVAWVQLGVCILDIMSSAVHSHRLCSSKRRPQGWGAAPSLRWAHWRCRKQEAARLLINFLVKCIRRCVLKSHWLSHTKGVKAALCIWPTAPRQRWAVVVGDLCFIHKNRKASQHKGARKLKKTKTNWGKVYRKSRKILEIHLFNVSISLFYFIKMLCCCLIIRK